MCRLNCWGTFICCHSAMYLNGQIWGLLVSIMSCYWSPVGGSINVRGLCEIVVSPGTVTENKLLSHFHKTLQILKALYQSEGALGSNVGGQVLYNYYIITLLWCVLLHKIYSKSSHLAEKSQDRLLKSGLFYDLVISVVLNWNGTDTCPKDKLTQIYLISYQVKNTLFYPQIIVKWALNTL